MLTCSSSSALEAATSCMFDVFLSFRGDIRRQFASHLYNRLKSIGFRVYLDEKTMGKGEQINDDLKKAIANSRICMPIFSKNYASSRACLFELSHMVQCEKKIIPIFYDVTPADVKLKTPLYKEQLEDHRGNPKFKLDEVMKWEKALEMVAEKAGYGLQDKNEAEEITTITRALIRLIPKDQDVTSKLVQFEQEVACVKELLDLQSNSSRIVGIFGMGGIGKTTLAKIIFNQLKPSFLGCCSFLENVRESLLSNKLLKLQRQLYKDVIDPFCVDSIHSSNDGIELIKIGLKNKKVLLVLDDMSDKKQFTDLLGHHVHLTNGSRLIITTRDRKVLDDLNQEHKNVQIYKLNEMNGDQALKLFSKCAFMEDSPPEEFECLSKEVVSYAGGLPLALEVFGSTLSGCSKGVWKGILEMLRKFPNKSIESRLMMSYHGLRSNEQKIFLDIACYCGNLDKTNAWYTWEDCGWYPEFAVRTLEEHSLIKIIVDDNEYFWMHDVLKDLGRAFIQDEADKKGRIPSRLRIESSLDILHETKEKAHVETLIIDAPTITITREDMVGLRNLRFLQLRVKKVKGDFNGLIPNLRWFYCVDLKELKAINFNPKKLVVLDLEFNKRLKWKMIRKMKPDKLKALRLSCFKPADPSWFLPQRNFMWILNATNLEKLHLKVSYTVTDLEEMGKHLRIRDLVLWDVKFKYLPHLPSSLLHLRLNDCEFVDGILDLSNLKNLISFTITDPKQLYEIRGLEKLFSLEALHFMGLNNINCLRPNDFSIMDVLTQGYLKNLKGLKITSCMALKELPEVSCLKRLSSLALDGVERIMSFDGLESLMELSIEWCSSLENLPDLSTLRKLQSLTLWRCNKLKYIQGIPQLESLESVQIVDCDSLELSPPDITKLDNVHSVYIKNCNKLPTISKGNDPLVLLLIFDQMEELMEQIFQERNIPT